MFDQVFAWIIERLPEIIATITGFLYIIYSIERNVRAWPYGIISSAVYIYVFFQAGIYADMFVYVYYVVIGFYGWYLWSKGGSGNGTIPVKNTSPKEWAYIVVVTLVFFIFISYILKNYTPSTILYLDSLVTSLSITATWMLTRKMIEHWFFWIIVDSVSIGLYLYKNLYPSVILFAVYTILAVVGYYDWLKELKKEDIKTF